MGILNLNDILKKHAPEAYNKVVPLTSLKGEKVAIDAHNVMYTTMAIAHKEVLGRTNVIVEDVDKEDVFNTWARGILDFALIWIKQGITPIFIFDGKPIKEKDKTREKRKDAKDKVVNSIKELKESIDVKDELTHTPMMMTELRKKMSQLTYVTKDNEERLIQVLQCLNIPYAKAKYDGEQLCSMLCLQGVVKAVYSKDTDNLVYGCPIVIKNYSYSRKNEEGVVVPYYETIIYKEVLEELKMNKDEFTDMCISLGCDYNQRISGYGPVKVYNLIVKYKNIDKYPIEEKKVKSLDHVNCRNIFKEEKYDCLIDKCTSFNIKTEFDSQARDMLESYNLSGYINAFYSYYTQMNKKPKFIIKKISNI